MPSYFSEVPRDSLNFSELAQNFKVGATPSNECRVPGPRLQAGEYVAVQGTRISRATSFLLCLASTDSSVLFYLLGDNNKGHLETGAGDHVAEQ